MRVLFKAFDSKMASREKLFKHAAEFATQIGKDRLITMSHSEDRDNIVITIWYWGEEDAKAVGKPKAVGEFKKPDTQPVAGQRVAAEVMAVVPEEPEANKVPEPVKVERNLTPPAPRPVGDPLRPESWDDE